MLFSKFKQEEFDERHFIWIHQLFEADRIGDQQESDRVLALMGYMPELLKYEEPFIPQIAQEPQQKKEEEISIIHPQNFFRNHQYSHFTPWSEQYPNLFQAMKEIYPDAVELYLVVTECGQEIKIIDEKGIEGWTPIGEIHGWTFNNGIELNVFDIQGTEEKIKQMNQLLQLI